MNMLQSKALPILLVLFLSLAFFPTSFFRKFPNSSLAKKEKKINPVLVENPSRLKNKAQDALKFAGEKGFNTEFAFLIDMSIHSGGNRFFVYDLKKDSLLKSGLVTHGRCNQDWLEGRKYGNTIGCGCTSLGRYKVGYKYQGRFGLAYKLYGLDKTNDKAFDRYVVLHSHECVPAGEVKDDICQSDGCPTVAPDFLLYLAEKINASKKPVLLWIYQ